MSSSNGPFAWGFKATLGAAAAGLVTAAAGVATVAVISVVDNAIERRRARKEKEQEDKEVSSEG